MALDVQYLKRILAPGTTDDCNDFHGIQFRGFKDTENQTDETKVR